MIIYPAIDIMNGKCVRLTQGRYDQSAVYGDDPAEMARRWAKEGASWIHIVDLDGARAGRPVNSAVIKRAVEAAGGVPIQLGGGIRTMADIESAFALGVSRVILGTSAVCDRTLVARAVARFGDKVAVGIDAKDGKVAISGWEEVSDEGAVAFARAMEKAGVGTVIYTDIATDGMLSGPNLAAMEEMSAAVGMNVIASGGVSCAADVKNLIPTGVGGVIIGRALYTGAVKLEDCLCLQNE
ncbi:1-(5-phosphoribosyl)-5-[(5-phosphoribosylamino) methylideneamino] imidazole-4-carboxamide isomerase [Clostridia bacterium]|nr:1-(5-phosphoribosyl)-5-[(5-phosphoribosylamino) methylideneamino] imidazole-4-carboxamide isomerase [Clostridia bacterium]